MTGLRGINFAADKRSSDKAWTARPHAKNVAARKAWDHFSKDNTIVSLQLKAGHWLCTIPGGGCLSMEAAQFTRT